MKTDHELHSRKLLPSLLSNGLRLIDCIVRNAVFNIISFISRRPVHLSMLYWSSFNQRSALYSFQDTGCFPTEPFTNMDSGERRMNLVAMTISSIFGKKISRAVDRTSNLPFSGPVHYQLSYGTRRKMDKLLTATL